MKIIQEQHFFMKGSNVVGKSEFHTYLLCPIYGQPALTAKSLMSSGQCLKSLTVSALSSRG